MFLIQRVVLRLRSLLFPRRLARDVDDELRYHVERQVAEYVARGMSPAEARTAALRAFGGVQRYKEEVEDEHAFQLFDQLRQDLAYTARAARRSPGFTAIVILTLALGIGATTAIFSVVRGVLLRELPFGSPDRLVRLWLANPTRNELRSPISVPDLADWQRITMSFDRLAGYSTLPTGLALVDGGEPVRLKTGFVSTGFFETLGVGAVAGRTILPSEHAEGQDRVVVLSHRLWSTRYGSARDIIGKTLRLNDEPFTVVGVMPADFRFPDRDTEIWTPISVVPASGIPRTRGVRWLEVVARVAPGVTPERARADQSLLASRLATEYGDTNAGWTAATLVPLRDELLGSSRGRVLVLFGAVLLTLILACVNVANLVLARASRRARELAVRTALGADRARLARQLFTESVTLSLVGGILGVLLAAWGVRVLVSLIGPWLPAVGDVRVDGAVLAFAVGVSILTGLAFGLIPVMNERGNVAGTLRESGRGNTGAAGAHALRRALVALEVGLAMMLVVGAGLLVKSFARLNQVALGFDADKTLYVRMTIPSSRYATSANYLPVADRMLAAARQVAGVTAAAMAKDGPMRAGGEPSTFVIPAQAASASAAEPRANFLPSSDGIIRALGIPLVAGRDLTVQDGDSGATGVVISAALARKHWPGRSPLGEEIEVQLRRMRVIGVAGDARYTSVQGEPVAMVYVPNRIMTRRIFTVIARTAGDPEGALSAVRDAIRSVERDQPITEIGTTRSAVGDAVAAPRVLTLLVGAFGVVALLLAAIGVYGVVAYVVGQRTNEIGIRIALGANSADIVRWTLRTGLAPALVGLGAGTAAALALSRLLGAQLYEVSPKDPGVFGGVAAVLVVVAILASGVPARRAARVDPAIALRAE
jgi:predicted permease